MAGHEREIDNQARDLAHKLDTGHGMQVADILRDEFRHMSPQDYNRLVNKTAAYDDKRYGANIEVVPREGSIIIDTGKGEIYVGNVNQERRDRQPDDRGRDGDRDRDRDRDRGRAERERAACENQTTINNAAGGAVIGALGGLIFGDRGKAAAIGAVGGAAVGGIVGHEKGKVDCP